MTIYQGDTANNLITIELENKTGIEPDIQKAILQIGNLKKTYNNPIFPLTISLDANETRKLTLHNNAYLAIYNSKGEKQTVEGTLFFETHKEVVKDED